MKRMFMDIFILLCILSVKNVAAQNTTYYPQVFFDKKDALNKLDIGNSSIKGVAFAKEKDVTRRNGIYTTAKKHYANNNTIVMLFPYTDYFEEWYDLRKTKGKNNAANIYMSEEAFKHRIETRTDSYGNFIFEKIKAGKYYLECTIDYVGTGVGSNRVGTSTTYNVYNVPLNSTAVYESYYYNYNDAKTVSDMVEITKDGQLVEVKLKSRGEAFFTSVFRGTKCYRLNNLQCGTCKEFYETGKIKTIADWDKNMLEGDAIYYHENGNRSAEGKNKKNFKVGLWKYYDENGTLSSEENFKYKDKMSYIEGVNKVFFASGKVKRTTNYKAGLASGEAIEYFESGNVKIKYYYQNNILNGKASYYDEKGTLTNEIKYLDGKEVK